jgi:chromosome segregation ATPase
MQDPAQNQDTARKRAELQRDLIMVESDLKKENTKKVNLESELRGLKKQEAQIGVEMQQKQTEIKKTEFEIMQLEVKMRDVRKKMNLLN